MWHFSTYLSTKNCFEDHLATILQHMTATLVGHCDVGFGFGFRMIFFITLKKNPTLSLLRVLCK